ncbi:MAG: M14 family metallopeptidase [Planctomycetota bacterium]|nr:M14 family metallopeptidase [Planctomycetota bacterium]
MHPWRPFARLTLILVLFQIPFGVGRAQTTPEIRIYRNYTSFFDELEKLGQHELCTVRSLGKTANGRDILVATIASGEADAKPAILVLGSVHAAHLLGSYLTVEMAKKLVADEEAAALLERTTFYFIPRPSPDATERSFGNPDREVAMNSRPHDDDRDDRIDEDGPEDLNGDGMMTMMRVKDSSGEWLPHPKDPRILIKADRVKNEQGMYLLYTEGRDNDGDERWNEDPVGGVDFNRNMTFKYPSFKSGAGSHAVSEPETRAVMDFAFDHLNIAAVFCFTPDGNLEHMWKPNSGSEKKRNKTTLLSKDAPYVEHLAKAYQDLHEMKDAPKPGKPAGSFLEWAYFHYGRWALGTRGWWVPKTKKEKEKDEETKDEETPGTEDGKTEDEAEKPGDRETEQEDDENQDEEAPESKDEGESDEEKPAKVDEKKGKDKEDKRGAEELRALKWLDENHYPGFVEWEKIEHPDFPGKEVEVGGFYPRCRLNPPVELAEKLIDPNVDMLKLIAERLPRLELIRDRVDDLGDGLLRIRVRLINSGFLRTESNMGSTSRQLQRLQIELQLPEGAELLTAPARRSVGALDGNGGKTEQTWLVRFGESVPETVAIRAWAPHVGEASLDLKLEAGR